MHAPLPAWPFYGLKRAHYNLILIDPPWTFRTWSKKGEGKSPQSHYSVMQMDKIRALPVADLAADNCLLLCWVTAPLLPEQLKTIAMWGFEYKTFLHWSKITKNGKSPIGTGFRVRNMGEILVLATIGKPKHKAFRGNITGIRRENSRKPDEVFREIERCCPRLRKRCDVFSRQERKGWHSFGDEVGYFERAH